MLGDDRYVMGENGHYVKERLQKMKAQTEKLKDGVKRHFGLDQELNEMAPLAKRRDDFFNGKYPCDKMLSALAMVMKKKGLYGKKGGMYRQYVRSISGEEPTLEFHVQLITSLYMEVYYPDERYRVDLAGLNLSKRQRCESQLVNKDRGWHDFEIPRPKGQYSGLAMELKRFHDSKGSKTNLIVTRGPRKGKWMNDHYLEQHENNIYMRDCGRASGFVIGAAACLEVIDCYFNEDFERMNAIMIV